MKALFKFGLASVALVVAMLTGWLGYTLSQLERNFMAKAYPPNFSSYLTGLPSLTVARTNS